MSSGLVQYILLRSDLLQGLGWNVGALVAQACHAATAVLHLHREDPLTQQYLTDLDNMHKVVLEVPNEEALTTLSRKFDENTISHKLWIEQPENIATCIALKPYRKEDVKNFLGKYQLDTWRSIQRHTVHLINYTEVSRNLNLDSFVETCIASCMIYNAPGVHDMP